MYKPVCGCGVLFNHSNGGLLLFGLGRCDICGDALSFGAPGLDISLPDTVTGGEGSPSCR